MNTTTKIENQVIVLKFVFLFSWNLQETIGITIDSGETERKKCLLLLIIIIIICFLEPSYKYSLYE